jgi:hypothetical protein
MKNVFDFKIIDEDGNIYKGKKKAKELKELLDDLEAKY